MKKGVTAAPSGNCFRPALPLLEPLSVIENRWQKRARDRRNQLIHCVQTLSSFESSLIAFTFVEVHPLSTTADLNLIDRHMVTEFDTRDQQNHAEGTIYGDAHVTEGRTEHLEHLEFNSFGIFGSECTGTWFQPLWVKESSWTGT